MTDEEKAALAIKGLQHPDGTEINPFLMLGIMAFGFGFLAIFALFTLKIVIWMLG